MTLQKTTINSFSKTGRVGNIMCASVQAFMKTHQHKGTPINEERNNRQISQHSL